jgi:TorA maturation chaperone TorD
VSGPLLEELAVDYCQLFVGPQTHLPPIQSVWDSGQFAGDAARSMQQFIECMEVFEPCVSIVDHLAVQLQFAARLYSIPLGLMEPDERESICGLARLFFDQHLRWPDQLLQQVQQRGHTAFYQGLGRVTQSLLFSGAEAIR